MIRVLQVVTTMDLGGAETMLMNIYRNIDREKVQFDFLCHNRAEGKYSPEIILLGGVLYSIPGPTHGGFFAYKKRLYEFFMSHPEYRIVHTHHNLLNGVILAEAKRAGVPNRFAHSHIAYSPPLSELPKTVFLKSFLTSRNVTKAFACAQKAGEFLYHGKLKRTFQVIPNAVDAEKFCYSSTKRKEIRAELGIKDEPVFGHIGRFMKQKNHRFLLEIFREVLSISPDAHLMLIGEGVLLPEIRQYANSLNIAAHVHFLGSRQDIPSCMSAMDLLLFPSLFEGLSVVCVEAQAAGLPILTSDTVSDEVVLTDLVRQVSLHESPERWARIALKMSATGSSDDRRTYVDRIRESGYDIKTSAKKMERLYLQSAGET